MGVFAVSEILHPYVSNLHTLFSLWSELTRLAVRSPWT